MTLYVNSKLCYNAQNDPNPQIVTSRMNTDVTTPDTKNSSKQDKISFLAELPLFRGVGENALKTLTSITKEYEFDRGAIIAYEGDLTEGLYIVQQGQLEPFKLDKQRQYQRVETIMYGAGDWFADIWLFQPSVHTYTIRARRSGRLLLLTNDGWVRYLKDHGNTLSAIFPHLMVETQHAVLHSRFQTHLSRDIIRNMARQTGSSESDPTEPTALGRSPEELEDEFDEDEMPDPKRAKRYATLKLLPEEIVYFEKRRSSKFFSAQIASLSILAVFLFAIPVILLGTSGVTGAIALTVGGVLASLPLIAAFITWIDWRNSFFLITNKQIVHYELNIFRFQTIIERADLSDVQSVAILKPNFLANLLKVGSASITTAAQSKVIFFDFIDDPKAVETEIQRISNIQERRKESQKRAALRQAIEGYFNVPDPLTSLDAPKYSNKAGTYSRFRKFMGEWIGRSEQNGVITYHKHPVSLVPKLIFPSIVLVLNGIALLLMTFLAPALFVLPAVAGTFIIITFGNLLWFIWRFEDWRNDTFQLTDRYIYDIDRLPFGFREDRKQAELSNVQNVATRQEGIIRTFFNYGDVQVETAGVDSDIVFESVKNPASIQNDIFAKRNKYRAAQEKQKQQNQQQEYALMIDLYQQSVEQGRIPRHHPLPVIEDDYEEEDYVDELDMDESLEGGNL